MDWFIGLIVVCFIALAVTVRVNKKRMWKEALINRLIDRELKR